MLYALFSFIIGLDQFTKYLAVKYLKHSSPIVLIKDFISFSYIENYGAAFGIMQDKKYFFIIITIIVILFIIIFLKNNYNKLSKLMRVALIMLMSGATGNLIDRIRQSYVIDFISVKFHNGYQFPVFNVADCFIVVSTILIILMVLFNKYEI